MVHEFLEQIQFRLPQCGTIIQPINEMLVEAPHQTNRVCVVCSPKAREHGPGAGQQERALQARDSFLTEQFSISTVACRKRYQACMERQIPDLANLQQAIVSRAGRAAQNPCGTNRELSIGRRVQEEIEAQSIRRRMGYWKWPESRN